MCQDSLSPRIPATDSLIVSEKQQDAKPFVICIHNKYQDFSQTVLSSVLLEVILQNTTSGERVIPGTQWIPMSNVYIPCKMWHPTRKQRYYGFRNKHLKLQTFKKTIYGKFGMSNSSNVTIGALTRQIGFSPEYQGVVFWLVLTDRLNNVFEHFIKESCHNYEVPHFSLPLWKKSYSRFVTYAIIQSQTPSL